MTIRNFRARTVGAMVAAMLALSFGSTDANACRGTGEFPDTAQRLASASIDAEKKRASQSRLKEGEAMHERAHRDNDKDLMRRSLKILDDVKKGL